MSALSRTSDARGEHANIRIANHSESRYCTRPRQRGMRHSRANQPPRACVPRSSDYSLISNAVEQILNFRDQNNEHKAFNPG